MPSAVKRVWRLLRAGLQAARVGQGADERAANPTQQAKTPHQTAVDAELARYYSNLEVPYGCDLATVRASWKRLVRKYHPDLHGADVERQRIATELVQGLNRAFEELRKHLKANH